MKREAKLQVTVRSQKVARLVEFEVPLITVYGKVGVTRRWATVYDYVLDERQARAVSQARELASSSGLPLEVVDLSREGPLRRLFRVGWSRALGVGEPRFSSGAAEAAKVDRPAPVSSAASRP